MNDAVYLRLAKVLDTLPNGFPATASGVEIRILKKIFTPEEADLFCDLKLHPETAAQIAERTGRPLEGLEAMLTSMWRRGEIMGANIGGVKVFKMMPWMVGICELQIDRMDAEFVDLVYRYSIHFAPSLVMKKPEIMQVLPVQQAVDADQQALSFQEVSSIIDSARSFAVNECICNKARNLKGRGCEKPKEICLGLSRIEGVFEDHPWGRPISREEAYAVLSRAEENALVHLSSNVQEDHLFICNCCGCCCPVLVILKKLGTAAHVNSRYCAEIDPEACTACGTCAEERCQVKAVEAGDDSYRVIAGKCIGCGLCVSTCPEEAIALIPKPDKDYVAPPRNQEEWMEARGQVRGVDFDALK